MTTTRKAAALLLVIQYSFLIGLVGCTTRSDPAQLSGRELVYDGVVFYSNDYGATLYMVMIYPSKSESKAELILPDGAVVKAMDVTLSLLREHGLKPSLWPDEREPGDDDEFIISFEHQNALHVDMKHGKADRICIDGNRFNEARKNPVKLRFREQEIEVPCSGPDLLKLLGVEDENRALPGLHAH